MKLTPASLLLIPLFILLPWAAVQMVTALDTNHAWLGIAAARLLGGGTMTGDFYDPNPPLSILIYVPHVLLSRLTGIAYYYMPALLGFVYLALSAAAAGTILKKFPAPVPEQMPLILTAYLMAATCLTGHWYFAERDALVLWGLFPLLLAQIALTQKIKLPHWLLWPVLILGTFAVLIKPHYVLLPAIVLVHRIKTQKRVFSIMRDPDFISLAAGMLVYAAVLFFFFSDFVRQIAPEMKSYVSLDNKATPLWSLLVLGIVGLTALCAQFFPVVPDHEKPARLSLIASVGCLALYFIQMKGFYYHLIPFMAFAYIGFALYVQGALIGCFGRKRGVFIAAVIIIALLPLRYMPPGGNITHQAYKNTRLARLVSGCAPDCSFFVLSENMETAIQVSTYTGAPWASRYPVLWWLPALRSDHPESGALKLHIDNVAADLNRYKPEYVAIILNRPLFASGDKTNFDYAGFLSRDPSFAEAFSHYRSTRLIEDDRNTYFTERPPAAARYSFIYAIYERTD